jgi:transposase
MAFLRIENKKSGTYLRIVESYKEGGKAKHRTLYSMGKVEDYPKDQLENIAKKLLSLSGVPLENIIANSFCEIGRVNYGYSLIINSLWKIFDLDFFARRVNAINKTEFDWTLVLQYIIAERLNVPCSKLQCYFHQDEYIGFGEEKDLQYFYRTLDILSKNQEILKEHLFNQQRNLFSEALDVVFYDVTTLYFDSNEEQPKNKRKKGYSKDGKAHKTQVVLGLLVDKLRNPVTYQIYEGNTYEGKTMIDALEIIKKQYKIDQIIVVADSGMIDKDNRAYMLENGFDFILGDRLKSLPENIREKLIDKNNYLPVNKDIDINKLSYTELQYQDRKIYCTYSEKRAKKDAYEREKLLEKAKKWLENPSKYKQKKKLGAGRYIVSDTEGLPIKLDDSKILQDCKYDGFKAISTTTQLSIEEVLEKYSDLFEVEHAFRTLKSQLEIRPMYHWTNSRIDGHIAMCFIAYTFLTISEI